jgi:meiotically up-regulated gene 157 (Mug157) protein
MLPFKFTDVKYLGIVERSKPVTKYRYELTDSDKGIWTFDLYEEDSLLAFGIVPLEYNKFRGTVTGRPFFREVEKAAKKAIESWKIKKDLSSQTAKTFEDIIDEL